MAIKTTLIGEVADNTYILEIDCNLYETHSFRSRLTDNPVEDGTSIVDHSVEDPFVLNIEGLLSDQGRVVEYTALERFEILNIMRKSATVLDISTPFQTYSDMIIESLRVVNNPELGTGTRSAGSINQSSQDLVRFSMKLKQVTIVNSLEAAETAPKFSGTSKKSNASTTSASSDGQSSLSSVSGRL